MHSYALWIGPITMSMRRTGQSRDTLVTPWWMPAGRALSRYAAAPAPPLARGCGRTDEVIWACPTGPGGRSESGGPTAKGPADEQAGRTSAAVAQDAVGPHRPHRTWRSIRRVRAERVPFGQSGDACLGDRDADASGRGSPTASLRTGTQDPVSAGPSQSVRRAEQEGLPIALSERDGIMTSTEQGGMAGASKIIELGTRGRGGRARGRAGSSLEHDRQRIPRRGRGSASPQGHRFGIRDDGATGRFFEPGRGEDPEGNQ